MDVICDSTDNETKFTDGSKSFTAEAFEHFKIIINTAIHGFDRSMIVS